MSFADAQYQYDMMAEDDDRCHVCECDSCECEEDDHFDEPEWEEDLNAECAW